MAGWILTRRRSARRAGRRFVAVAVAAAVVSAGLAVTASAQSRFTDVSSRSHPSHYANIEALDAKGVFDGTECGARRFCPGEPAKRWAVAVWIVRVIDGRDPVPVAKSRFADVDDHEWWMPYVERLADLGITVGCKQSPLRYCPHETVTRARMASFLVRAFRLQRAASAGFADTRGNTHETNIDALFAAKITVGCKQRPLRYCPDRPVTRAQMATLLNRGLGGSTGGGTTTTTTVPGGPVTINDTIRSDDVLLTASRGRTCVVRSDGGVSCWGGDEGFLNHLAASGLNDVVALSMSHDENEPLHTCAVHGNGDVSCWGAGTDGQLGAGDEISYYLPVEAVRINDAAAVAAGTNFTCAVHDSGEVSCWGDNRFGQLGSRTSVLDSNIPQPVSGLRDAVAIAAGQNTACAIEDRGEISCWGGPYRSTPEAVTGLDDAVSIAIGIGEICAVTDRGEVFCWRSGDVRVGLSSQFIVGINDAVEVSAGDETFCVLHRGGAVSCWGENDAGQVGDGTTRFRSRPVRVSGIDDAVDISVSAGSAEVDPHSCALLTSGSVYCWGGNEYGQLGDGSLRDRDTPVRARVPARVAGNQEPDTETELLVAWLDTAVRERHGQFPGLSRAWNHIRSWTFFSRRTLSEPLEIDCSGGVRTLGCRVDSLTVNEISLDVLRELVRVYDLHQGLAPARSWGAVQLYFASTYSDCFTSSAHRGSEILADTMMHLLVPEAELTYYDSAACNSLPTSPNAQAEQVASDGMRGRVTRWYTTSITTGTKLFTEWRKAPSLPALANLSIEYGGLCSTNWVDYPFVTSSFPASDKAFKNDGC